MGRLKVAPCAAVLAIAIALPASARAADQDDLSLDLGASAAIPADAGTSVRRLELRHVPKGTFVQGSAAADPYHEPDEVQRNVTFTKGFWMGKYPITRAQFARFVSETRHVTDAEKGTSGGWGWDGIRLKQSKEYTWRSPGFTQKDEDPVTLVTFGDANAFTAWASRKTGRRVRLPTEAEFEYAARGGSTAAWPGAKTEEEAVNIGWYRPAPGAAVGTHPVGGKKPNPFGLYDMSGNVNQWCRDVYAPWTTADATDPENTTNTAGADQERRVLRGGSWMRDARKGRSAARYRNTPGTRNADNGFRVVVEEGSSAVVTAPVTDPSSSSSPPPAVSAGEGGDAAAPAEARPSVKPASSSTEGIGWAFLAAPAAAISFVVAWMLARRNRGLTTNAQGITTRPGEDGFWVRAPKLPPGSRVRYTCIVAGREVSDIVPLDGEDETFVFTGGRPSLIQISDAAAVAPGQAYRATPAPAPPPVPSAPASMTGPVMLQRSPWPSDRGSIRNASVAVPAAAEKKPSLAPARAAEPFAGYPGAYR